MTLSKDIADFHEKFQLPQPQRPSLLTPEMAAFRIKFMQEELDEFILAHRQGNLAECLDALVDIVYVAIGTAWLMNLPFDRAWSAVHGANMQKIRAERPTDSKRGTSFDVIKPPGWKHPNIEEVIDQYQMELPL